MKVSIDRSKRQMVTIGELKIRTLFVSCGVLYIKLSDLEIYSIAGGSVLSFNQHAACEIVSEIIVKVSE